MRLTKKELMSAINQPMCFGSRLVGKKMFAQIIKELCEYKTIEEKLGIDLITLFKALRQFFAKDLDCYCPRPTILFQDVRDEWYIGWCSHYYKLKDYGKTWALTKEALK